MPASKFGSRTVSRLATPPGIRLVGQLICQPVQLFNYPTGSLIVSLPICQLASQPTCQPTTFPANQVASRFSTVHSAWSATRRKMFRQHYFTPKATACHKPPGSQPVCFIASLLVMRVASKPICQLANFPVSRFSSWLSAVHSDWSATRATNEPTT